MSSPSDFPARGRVIDANDERVVFQPAGTTYQVHLRSEPEAYSGPVNKPVRALIRVMARKAYTVPSGGNFIAPIYGSPRIVQGRVLHADDRMIVVHAGCPVVVDLPASDSAIDLGDGHIRVGEMVNVVVLPGATMHLVDSRATQGAPG